MVRLDASDIISGLYASSQPLPHSLFTRVTHFSSATPSVPAMDPSTLSHHKSSFLLSQIRLLSTPLHPSPTLTSTLTHPSTPLTDENLTEFLTRVNTKIIQHNKFVFPAQTQRHIVEQIESLYFSESLADHNVDDAGNEGVEQGQEIVAIERDAKLTSSTTIAGLPEELHQCMLYDISDISLSSSQAEEYQQSRLQLQQLSQQRDATRQKLQRYQKMQELLKPFENAQENVQPNLVGKDGEMAREMERMRGLVARVRGRMGEYDEPGERRGEGREMSGSKAFEEKLRVIMDMERT